MSDLLRIAFVPLDDRPCNLEQVEDLARLAGMELLVPPPALVASHGLRPERFESLCDWLDEALGRCSALALSLDQWLYGGLIQSRKLEVPFDECAERLQRLRALTDRHPRVRLHFSNILLRLSVTVTATQSEDDWRNVFNWSVLSDRVLRDPGAGAELDAVRARIPPALLEEYMAVRERNHRVNLALLGMAPALSTLLYGQEDCAPEGLHRSEKVRLQQEIAKLPPEPRGRVTVMTGADELGAMLVMRAFMEASGVLSGTRDLRVAGLQDRSLDSVSAYEDIPARENLLLHFLPSPFRVVEEGRPEAPLLAPSVVRIFPFGPKGQRDLCFEAPETGDRPEVMAFTARFRPGDSLLDLSHGNGADPALMRALARELPLESMEAFSAWNTTGNRLGTLVAHLAIAHIARELGVFEGDADRWFLRTQLIDHFLYQAEVRPLLTAECKRRGLNPWALTDDAWREFSAKADALLRERAVALGLPADFRASLPWKRLFEISIRQQG